MTKLKLKLKSNEYAVGQAEYATGHVLNIDKTIYRGDGDIYLRFESKDSALEYMKKTITEYPDIECWMEDASGEHVITLDKNGKRK